MKSLKQLAKEYNLGHEDVFDDIDWSNMEIPTPPPVDVETELKVLEVLSYYSDRALNSIGIPEDLLFKKEAEENC